MPRLWARQCLVSQGKGRVVVQHRYSTTQERNHDRRRTSTAPRAHLDARRVAEHAEGRERRAADVHARRGLDLPAVQVECRQPL